MQDRREFLGAISLPVAAGAAAALLDPLKLNTAIARMAEHDVAGGAPHPAGDPDDAFWFDAAQAFTIDRSILNLNNGGCSPAPISVQRAFQRHIDYCNSVPPPVSLWQVLDPQVELVRERGHRRKPRLEHGIQLDRIRAAGRARGGGAGGRRRGARGRGARRHACRSRGRRRRG
jgi:hypothetical protein